MIDLDSTTSLGAVGASEWNDTLGPRSFYLTHQWLAAQDTGQPVDPVYLLARADRCLVGALPTYVVHRETNEFYEPRQCADGRWSGRYLLAGARRAYTNDVLVDRHLTAPERQHVERTLIEGALDRAEGAGLDAALFLYLGTDGAERICGHYPNATPLFTTAEAVLDLPGTGFDDYLAALPAKRRREVRREVSRFAGSGSAVTTLSVDGHWERLASLFGEVQRRYGHAGDDEVWRRVVQRQTVRVAADAVILGCLAGKQLVGAVLIYPWRGTVYAKLVGFNYDRLQAAYEYFNLVFYGVIRYAYDHGLSRVRFGREALEAKVRRGARLDPLWSVAIGRRGGDTAGVPDWNGVQAERLRAAYHWAPRTFTDRGWSLWGCA